MKVYQIITEANKPVKSYGKGAYSGFQWEKLGNGDIRVTTPDGNTSVVDKSKQGDLKKMADKWIKDWEEAKKAASDAASKKAKAKARAKAKKFTQRFLKWGGRSFVFIRTLMAAAKIENKWDEHIQWQEDHYYNYTMGVYGQKPGGGVDLKKNEENYRRAQDVAVGALIASSSAEIARAAQQGYLVVKVLKNIRNMIAAGSVAFSGFIGPAVIWVITEAAFWLFERWIGNVENIKELMTELYKDGITEVRKGGIAEGYFKEGSLAWMGGQVKRLDVGEKNAIQLMKLDPGADAAEKQQSTNLPDTSKPSTSAPSSPTQTGPSSSNGFGDLDSRVNF